ESVRAIRRNAEHLLHLMNDVLDMSKLGEGKLLIRETSADIAELLDDVRLFAESRARAAGLGFRIELTTQTPGAIRTDPGRLRQVLFNLLGNALKFTHEGSITLRCWFDSMTEQIVFEIEDTGIGMDVPTLQRVRAFEAFTQGDGSSARRHGGTGLGLHISHSLAQLLGGSIEIESAPGRGSTFFVSVATGEIEGGAMLLDGRFAGRSKPEGAAPPDPTDSSPLRGRRILVADDNPDNRRLLTHHLGRAGAETEVAGNGREAVERVRADDYGFDLVLTDLQMPELDGYGAARALRSLGFAGPIIAVTANDLGSDRRASLEAGCDSYLTKPIDARQLVQTCLESLRNSRTAGADAA
ncbi:MAG: ATP-binding protein, partial [Planctomycetota bacterium]